MATKEVNLPEIGKVKLYKRRDSRSIRLSVTTLGEIRVSLPYWLPYEAGAKFALAKRQWIVRQLQQRSPVFLMNGQSIGKSHHLYFVSSADVNRIATRLDGTTIRVNYPVRLGINDPSVQRAAELACIRALRAQASALLPQRLQTLAETHQIYYRSARIKRLKGRWGSCDTDKNIVLNLFLMKLPWHLIDYVLVHELTHTKVLHHGDDFWQEFERLLPGAKLLRREIRQFHPVVAP